MKLVLLSGGSGKRLWPLSNDARSKQFIKVLQNPNGGYESMVQRVWRQLSTMNLQSLSYIATGKSQVEVIQNQLDNQAPLIVEPERRDTFPAITLAATYLYSVVEASEDEVVVILPVDPYVEDVFFNKVKELEKVINETGANLALIGVKPTYPSEKYGYIVPANVETGSFVEVSHFREKPTEIQAEELIKQNALWNCGVFAFRLGYLLDILRSRGISLHYNELREAYHSLPKISFDYEVVERAEQIVVLPYEGDWKDLGTWNTLTEEMDSLQIGKGFMHESCHNTHVVNELDIPVTVIGLDDTIVATSPDGILVSAKSASPKIKDVMKDYDQKPMYEERRWGWYRIIDYFISPDSHEVITRRICITSGNNLSYQYHEHRSEVWTIVSGEGEVIVNGNVMKIKAGDVIKVNPHDCHALRAISNLEIIEVQKGNPIIEEDIHRLEYDWNNILCSTVHKYIAHK